jgi:DNA-binding transcriptional ArsR family regulator
MRPSELARTYDLSPATVRYHLAMLERERFVEVVKSGRYRTYRWTSRQLVLATPDELEAAGLV